MQKVSIIVPIYNVEKYLKKCIDSIVRQTYKNLEIILVDDGSTDNSGHICEEYKAMDSRIVIIKQENQGLSAARNVGLATSTGAYVNFIDSDDYIAQNMIEVLVSNLEETGADMATCGIYNVYKNCMLPQYLKKEKYVCDNIEAYRQILIGNKIPGSICNKLIKKECIVSLRFPLGKHYEDAFFHIDLMQQLRCICVDTQPLYYYVHRRDSITTQKYDKSSYDVILAYEENMRMVQKNCLNLLIESKFRVLWAYFVVLDRILQEEKYWLIEDYKKVKKYLKKNVWEIIKNPYFTRNRKIATILLKINIRMYRILLKKELKNKDMVS